MKKKVEITAVLDKSSSMSSIYKQTINGFNSYLRNQRTELNDRANFTLIQFNHNIEVKWENLKLDEVPDLNTNNFRPNGTTSLYDAIGTAIKLQKKRNKAVHPDSDVITIILIITDGLENSSSVFNREKIFKKIEKFRKKHSWKFIYIGANQDAIFEAEKIGIQKETSIDYCLDDNGIKDIYESVSNMVIRNSKSKALHCFEDADRKKQQR